MPFALYRKYRPQSFDDLQGQVPVRSILLEALRQNKVVHAYLFSGPRGTGKTTTARLIAKAIQCENRLPNGEPCNACTLCLMNIKGELVDLVEIDAASNRGIDEIRDLREKIRFAPTLAKAKVYIIDEVHMLTKEAFNALLKSLEEPPSHVYFILATTEIHKIPETILSRCQRHDFKKIPDQVMVDRLTHIAEQEGLEVDSEALRLIARLSGGGLRDAISLLEQLANEPLSEALVRQKLGLARQESCEELYGALGSADTQKGLHILSSLHEEGIDLDQFTRMFLSYLREKIHEAVDQKKNTLPTLLRWADLFDDAYQKLKRASIVLLPLELAVIRGTQGKSDALSQSPEIKPTLNTPEQSVPERLHSSPKGLYHMEAIQKQLPKIFEAIEIPAVRSSFQTSQLGRVNRNFLTFVFTSQFHLQKVRAPEALVAVEAALQKVLGEEFKILLEMEEVKPHVDAADLGWDTVEEPL